jgi:signal transduction histidine kinase
MDMSEPRPATAGAGRPETAGDGRPATAGEAPAATAPAAATPAASLERDDDDWTDAASRPEQDFTSPGELRRFDIVLALVALGLAVGSVITLLPGARIEIDSPNLDLVLNTLTAVAAAGAAALAWIRYRIEREVSAVYESSAFLVLFATRALLIVISIAGHPERAGLTIDTAQQWPLYGWTLARLTSAGLLVFAAGASLRRAKGFRLPVLALQVGPVAILLAILAILPSLEGSLPTLIGPDGIAALKGNNAVLPGMEPLGLVLQAVVALVYLGGAMLYRDIYRQRGRRYAGYLSIALVVAAFSQLHWAILPGIYDPLVTTDDILRATFSVILLLGIDAQSRADVRALRLANARLHALRRADAERASLEASARLAREVHDGLSQDLWLAKLKHGRLSQVPDLSPEAKSLAAEVGDAVDRALSGARAVLATMRTGSDSPTVGEALERAVEDFGQRSGLRAEFTSRGTPPALPSRSAAELLRIVQEALTNVSKHADATVVRVEAAWGGATFEVTITDNGRGFNVLTVDPTSYGMKGMRERAGLIGGEVEILSRKRDGTRVVIRVPGRIR